MEQIMVKIIKGTYGHCQGNAVIKKTEKDEPFLLDANKASRLFGLGVAEPACDDTYSESSACDADKLSDDQNENDEKVSMEDMTLEELKEFAEPYGLKFKFGMKKVDFIAQIQQAMLSDKTSEEYDEQPPSFDAAEAVQ